MKKQTEMVESFALKHEKFMANFNASLDELDHDLTEAQEIDAICTNEWCQAIERDIDDLQNSLYSISEPRFSCSGHSKKLRKLRQRLHDIYAKYKGISAQVIH